MPFHFPGCEVERAVFEHIRVVGPTDLAEPAAATLASYGFRVTRSGPYTDREMHPTVDVKRFLFLGERQVREFEVCEDCFGTGSPSGECAGMICGNCVGTGLQPQVEPD